MRNMLQAGARVAIAVTAKAIGYNNDQLEISNRATGKPHLNQS